MLSLGHTAQTAKRYYRLSRVTAAHTTTAYATVMGDNTHVTPVTPVTPVAPVAPVTPVAPVYTSITTVTTPVRTAPTPATSVTPVTSAPTPTTAGKSAWADKVATQTARGEVIARVAEGNVDGSLHPFLLSNKKKVPATDWERSWLLKYFMNLKVGLVGNYYR
jgi:hypothetical protein